MERPRYRFFGGKGGVGKTTLAAATAIALARAGARVLALSTDPAHSLGDALGRRLGPDPRAIRGARGLFAMELAADRALERWLSRRKDTLAEIADRGTWLDRTDVERFLSLSFPGVDELVALLEITRLAAAGNWDEVVVDTAPTGHTLRMLAMPATLERLASVLDDMQEKHRLIAESLGGREREDEADRLIEEIRSDAVRLAGVLRDTRSTRFHWVTAAEPLAIAEAADGVAALADEGIAVSELLVNRLTPPRRGCALCSARRLEERRCLDRLPPALRALPRREIEESEGDVLRAVGRALAPSGRTRTALPRAGRGKAAYRGATPPGEPGTLALGAAELVLVGGKGGVGKSTCAAALALEVAADDRSSRILLLSIDPAHSLADALGVETVDGAVPGAPPNLHARELDAPAAFTRVRERYRGAVDQLFDRMRGGSRFDASWDRAIVRDLLDLAPPGLDEIFAVLAVVEALGLDGGRRGFDRVFLDTAPTGHALRLLEMPERAAAWVRTLLEVLLKYQGILKSTALAEDLVALARGLRALRTLLADPARTAFVVVARPEPLVSAETKRLLASLRDRKIAVRGLVLNALTPPGCARCRAVARRDARVARDFRKAGCAIIHAPLTVPPPRGAAALRAFRASWRAAASAR